MGSRIRVGILGFAHYHANFWSEVFRDSPLAEFVGGHRLEVGIGLESADDHVREVLVNKGFNRADFERVSATRYELQP